MANRQDLEKSRENELVEIVNKRGVEQGVEKILMQNMPLIPPNVDSDRIKSAAGFYIANKSDLMSLDKNNKLLMLYGVLKEAIVGCEAGLDYDILLFKGKPTICRKKEGWFKIIELIKPAEIIKFVVNVATVGDEIYFDPVEEKVQHIPRGERGQKLSEIIAAYAFIRFANGFEKTVFLDKNDITHIYNLSPSKDSSYSPWHSHSVKMVKTKAAKELAKELYTLYSGRLNSVLQQAVMSDEEPVMRIDSRTGISTDDTQNTPAVVRGNETQPRTTREPEVIDAAYEEIPDDELNMDDLPA